MDGKNENKNRAGVFINRAGKKRYTTPESVGNVIRYVARENGKQKGGLVCWGAMGAVKSAGTDMVIREFELVQKMHRRIGKFGRYIDHEIYDLSPWEEKCIAGDYGLLEEAAREAAREIYEEGFQAVYAVHERDKDTDSFHIHFAVNTVNYRTGKKRHENKQETKKRGMRIHRIIERKADVL